MDAKLEKEDTEDLFSSDYKLILLMGHRQGTGEWRQSPNIIVQKA